MTAATFNLRWCSLDPVTHSPGLFYYHPHFHGSSGLQAMASMAGCIIVDDLHLGFSQFFSMKNSALNFGAYTVYVYSFVMFGL